MVLKAEDIIVDAMNLAGATEMDEAPSSSEMQVGLRTLNMMLGRWSSDHLMLRSTSTSSFPLTGGKYKYTIGLPTSDFICPKPLVIHSAFLRDQNNNDYNIEIVPQTAYDALGDKAYGLGLPTTIYYDPGSSQQSIGEGNIYFYVVPDNNNRYTFIFNYDQYLTEFANISDIITFEPMYYEALVYGLAVRLYRRFHTDQSKQVPADLIALAAATLKSIETTNTTQLRATMDIPGKTSVFNVYTGEYN